MMWTQLVTGEIFMEILVSAMKETAKQCTIDILMTSVQVNNTYKRNLCLVLEQKHSNGLIVLFFSTPIFVV